MIIRSVVMYDSEQPNFIPTDPTDAAIAGYLHGGDPARPWKAKDWARFPGRRKLPIFVRSDPANSLAEDDAFAALRDLYELKAFGCLVALDIETANDPVYVAKWGDILQRYSYSVLPYGSLNNIFDNPALDGRWVAAPGKKLSDFKREQGVRAVQDTGVTNLYDKSVMHFFLAEHGPWWM